MRGDVFKVWIGVNASLRMSTKKISLILKHITTPDYKSNPNNSNSVDERQETLRTRIIFALDVINFLLNMLKY